MRKFMKICAITAVVLLVPATALFGLGGCGGGIQQTLDKLQKGDFSFTDEDLNHIMEDFSKWGEEHVVENEEEEKSRYLEDFPIVTDVESYETDYDLSGIHKLSLQIGGCELKVSISPDDRLHIRGESIKKMQDGIKDQTLFITATNKNGVSAKTFSKIEIRIPADFLWEEISAEFGAGDFQFEAIHTDNMKVNLGAGKLMIEALSCNTSFACEVGAGQAILTDAALSGDAQAKIGAGELKFEGRITGNLKAECAMGNLELCISDSTGSDHNYALECAAGNINIGDTSYSGLAARKDIDNGAQTTYELTCAMGNITLKFVY